MTSLMNVFVILRPSKGKTELKRITRVANKTNIFAKLLFGRGETLESSREKEREKGKNKEREERDVRIDEAFRDTAKRVRLRKKVTKTRKPETRREKENGEVQ